MTRCPASWLTVSSGITAAGEAEAAAAGRCPAVAGASGGREGGLERAGHGRPGAGHGRPGAGHRALGLARI